MEGEREGRRREREWRSQRDGAQREGGEREREAVSSQLFSSHTQLKSLSRGEEGHKAPAGHRRRIDCLGASARKRQETDTEKQTFRNIP